MTYRRNVKADAVREIALPKPDNLVIIAHGDHLPRRVFVYGMECGGYFKIGIAKDVEKRRIHLQLGCPLPLSVVFYRGVDRAIVRRLEKAMHYQLREKHLHGEWFSCSLPEIREAYRFALSFAAKHERRAQREWKQRQIRNADRYAAEDAAFLREYEMRQEAEAFGPFDNIREVAS